MKKFLALTLIVCLCLGLGVTALATTPEEAADMPIINGRPDDWPEYEVDPDDPYAIMPLSGNPLDMPIILPDSFPTVDADPNDPYGIMLLSGTVARSFVGDITVDGEPVNLLGVPGAPNGYLPMRVIVEAMGGYAEWIAEENAALFGVDGHSVQVNLSDLTVTCDFEPVEGVQAYLNPNGYTFLPASFLTAFDHIEIDDHPEMDSIRYDIAIVYSAEETLAQAIFEAAEATSMFQLDDTMLSDNYGFTMDAYDVLVAYQPIMTAQPTTVVIAAVKEGQMDTAKADFQAYLDTVKGTLGFYPATAEAMEKAQIVESADGVHLMLVSTWESNDAAVELFNAAFPAAE